MPCIVILVHGVNDVGEAYQNQENGIIAGLSKRLNRTDLYAHEWKDFMMMHNEEAQKKNRRAGSFAGYSVLLGLQAGDV